MIPAPMTPPEMLDTDLDRLAALLAGPGREPFLQAPIVIPDFRWFPDRWTPDMESVRVLTLRLMAYAGLPELDAECAAFTGNREPAWLPRELHAGPWREKHTSALFLGLKDGRAYFGVEAGQLARAENLVGVLAHEVAHAWRRTHALEHEDRAEEEELTDLTTVVLGLGILTANSSYRYDVESIQEGAMALTRTSHQTGGYIGPDRMCGLLAVQCAVRGDDPREIRKHLGVTQRQCFDSAYEGADGAALMERLNLTGEEIEAATPPNSPPRIVIRPGRAALAVHACAERIVAEVGDDGGMLPQPFPVPVDVFDGRLLLLAEWGRPRAGGGWARQIQLVEDPEWAARLAVLNGFDGDSARAVALGLVSDEVLQKQSKLQDALSPAFQNGDLAMLIAEDLPSFVRHGGVRGVLDIQRIGSLLQSAVARLDPETLRDRIRWLLAANQGAYRRIEMEAADEPFAGSPGPKDPKAALRAWWDRVTSPTAVADELEMWALMKAKLAEEARRAQPPGAGEESG